MRCSVNNEKIIIQNQFPENFLVDMVSLKSETHDLHGV